MAEISLGRCTCAMVSSKHYRGRRLARNRKIDEKYEKVLWQFEATYRIGLLSGIRKIKVHKLSSVVGDKKTFVALFDCGVYGVFDTVCVWMMVLFTEGTELIKTEDKYWETLCFYQGLNENKTKQNPLIMKYDIKLMVQILWIICLMCVQYGFRCMINYRLACRAQADFINTIIKSTCTVFHEFKRSFFN